MNWLENKLEKVISFDFRFRYLPLAQVSESDQRSKRSIRLAHINKHINKHTNKRLQITAAATLEWDSN